MNLHPAELINAYADGELSAVEAERVEAHLRVCTECAREVALIQSMGGAMREMREMPPRRSVWEGVSRRITRPVGWVLVVAGVVAWGLLALVEWYRERALTVEWLATTAVAIGVALLLAGVLYEQFRDWKKSPYKDVEQ